MDAISAAHVICRTGHTLSPGWIGIENGRIGELAEGVPPAELEVRIGGPGSILFPGFVNAHAHLALGSLRHVGDDLPFLQWILRGVLPGIEAGVPEPGFFSDGAGLSARELLAGGVTAVAENFLRPEGVDAMRSVGLKGIFFQEVFGSLAESDASYLGEVMPELDALASALDGFPFGYSPHTPWTCPPAVFAATVERARREGRRISFHLDESAEEHALFAGGSGRLHDMISKREQLHRYRFGATPTALLHEMGVLGPDAIAAHAVQVTDADIELLAASGTHVVHCPTSNLKLAEGVAPVVRMLERGVSVALGTDSAASTGRLDMFQEMRTFLLTQRGVARDVGALTAATAFDMATRGGAEALGMQGEVGVLEVGAAADCALLEVSEGRASALGTPEDRLVWDGTPADVSLVVVDGVIRHDSGASR